MYNLEATRGGAVEARRAHNPKVVGSNPTPATDAEEDLLHDPPLFCGGHLFSGGPLRYPTIALS
jgi:hypothetical protein